MMHSVELFIILPFDAAINGHSLTHSHA